MELSKIAQNLFDYVNSHPPTKPNKLAARILYLQLSETEQEKVARLLDVLEPHRSGIFTRADLEA